VFLLLLDWNDDLLLLIRLLLLRLGLLWLVVEADDSAEGLCQIPDLCVQLPFLAGNGLDHVFVLVFCCCYWPCCIIFWWKLCALDGRERVVYVSCFGGVRALLSIV
jgi:hypothetical protein